MSRKLFLSILAVSFVIIASAGILYAYTELDTAAAIRAEGQIPFTPGALLDDFNAGTTTNTWNCVTGTFAKDGTTASCTASYTSDPLIAYGGTGRSLQLNYNVNDVNSYAGYSSSLTSVLAAGNLSGYTAVSFYVKGAVGGEFFKIALKNASNEAALYITDYLDGGVTTGWRKVTIPFRNFANISNWSSMTEFLIIFENSQSVTNGSLTQGTIYIDNITFETTPASVVRIDYFGDKLGVNALGGNMGSSASGEATISTEFSSAPGEYDPPSKYGLKVNYNVATMGSQDDWASLFMILGGGADGWTTIPCNFSAYTKLTLKVRAIADDKNPKTIKLEIYDNAGAKVAFLYNVTAAWQTYTVLFSDISGLDRSSIKQINFTFVKSVSAFDGGNLSGTVIIDSIQVE